MIFVNIAAYRDPECRPTITDLFAKARYPHDINVGLVLQTLPGDDGALRHDRVNIVHLHADEARGPCWARHRGYQLWAGEDYVLQIDSHMRFSQDWDQLLFEQLARCASNKPILTTYPCAYEPPDTIVTSAPVFLGAKAFADNGMLAQQGIYKDRPSAPIKTAFIGAGFMFGPSAWISDVPYDPQLYFLGEETTLAARLWTNGWDLFGPTECFIWHCYVPRSRTLHWEDCKHWYTYEEHSMARVRRILRMEDSAIDVAKFDLGSARTFEDYQSFSGVDFRMRTIQPHATMGDFT
jgi:glycosyltransferase involved in cell wall biosynthesis